MENICLGQCQGKKRNPKSFNIIWNQILFRGMEKEKKKESCCPEARDEGILQYFQLKVAAPMTILLQTHTAALKQHKALGTNEARLIPWDLFSCRRIQSMCLTLILLWLYLLLESVAGTWRQRAGASRIRESTLMGNSRKASPPRDGVVSRREEAISSLLRFLFLTLHHNSQPLSWKCTYFLAHSNEFMAKITVMLVQLRGLQEQERAARRWERSKTSCLQRKHTAEHPPESSAGFSQAPGSPELLPRPSPSTSAPSQHQLHLP